MHSRLLLEINEYGVSINGSISFLLSLMPCFEPEIAVAISGNSKLEKKRVHNKKITMDLEFYCYNSNLRTIIT